MNTHRSPTPHTGRGARRTPDQPQRLLCRPAGPRRIALMAGLLAAALLLTPASLPAAVVASYDFEDGVAVYNFVTWDNDHNPNVTGPDAWTAVVSNGGNAQYGSNPAGSPRPPGEAATDCFAFGQGNGDYRKRFNATYVAGTNYGVSVWACQGTSDPGGAFTLELGRGTANNFVSLASTVIDTAGRSSWTRYSVTNLLTATSAIHSSNIVVRISGFTGDVWLDVLEIFTGGGGAASDVTIDFSITNGVGPKLNKLFGTYASEKTIFAEKIYDTHKTVGALNLPFNRQQLWLKEKPQSPNPSDVWSLSRSGATWTFEEQWSNPYLPNQVSVTHIGDDVLVTLGVPSGGDFLSRLMGANPSARNSALNELRQCFTDIVVKLRGPTYVGPTRPLRVELFGEPDLFNFFGPNNTFDEFWEVFTYAYAGVRAAGGANVRVGGSGHAFPEWPHLASFITAYYSFWFYHLMSANRCRITFANTDVNGFASVDGGGRHRVALWNRTSGSRTFTLGFQGLGPDLSQYTCTVHLVNHSTYQNTNQYPPVTQTLTLDNLGSLTLTREATAFLDIAGPGATTMQVTATGTNTLVVAWEGGGFRVQAQTNALDAGLSDAWFDYPHGASSPVIVPIHPTIGSVFLRLVSP